MIRVSTYNYSIFSYLDGHLKFLNGIVAKAQDRSTVTLEAVKITFLPCLNNLTILQADVIMSAVPEWRYNGFDKPKRINFLNQSA